MILLACAVEAELRFWKDHEDVEKLVTGIGPVEASCAVTAALGRGRYRLVVNAGLAGAFNGAATIGDGVAIADDCIELGLEDGAPLPLPPAMTVIEKARSDAQLVAALKAKGFPALHGVTVSSVTSTEATALRLGERGAQVESMEGFAVLRAAERAGVPALQLRGISNRCGDRARAEWDFTAGVRGLERILAALFEVLA